MADTAAPCATGICDPRFCATISQKPSAGSSGKSSLSSGSSSSHKNSASRPSREEIRLNKRVAEQQKKVQHVESQLTKAREAEKSARRDLIQRKGELAESRMLVERLRRDYELPDGVPTLHIEIDPDAIPDEMVREIPISFAKQNRIIPLGHTDDGVVLHDKDICIGCGYCFYACPFGAPQFPESGAFASRGKMDKCTFCAGGPVETGSAEEHRKYGANRLAEGKLPLCAEMCATKALLAGDVKDRVADLRVGVHDILSLVVEVVAVEDDAVEEGHGVLGLQHAAPVRRHCG